MPSIPATPANLAVLMDNWVNTFIRHGNFNGEMEARQLAFTRALLLSTAKHAENPEAFYQDARPAFLRLSRTLLEAREDFDKTFMFDLALGLKSFHEAVLTNPMLTPEAASAITGRPATGFLNF